MSNEVLLTGVAPDWCCAELDGQARRQSAPVWCVPACVAILSAPLREPLSEREAARLFGQDSPQPQPFDYRDARRYRTFKRELERRGLRELFGPGSHALLSRRWLRDVRRPVLVSAGAHAVICVGCCADSVDGLGNRQPAWRIIDPYSGAISWRALARNGYAMDFAFA